MIWTRRDWIILSAVTLLAAALRLYKLGEVPPGFQFDEAFNAIDATQLLHGNRPLFLPANGGREAIYTYFQATIGVLLGFNLYTLRLASALAGIAAIPATYLLLRTLLHRHSQLIATFTSLTLAISLWHIHFSHYGIRVITMPPLLCATFGLFWVGVGKWGREGVPASRRSLWALIGSGILTGVGVWTHPTGRFVPFVLIVYTFWLLWRHPQARRWSLHNPLVNLMITGTLALLVFLPLGLEFYRHPEFFFGHASEVSVFAERVGGDSALQVLGQNVLRVLGMFSFQGDRDWTHNLAGRPVFDPFLSLPFVIGALLWLNRLWRRRADDPDVDALLLLLLWALTMLAPSVFSEAAPNYSRTLPALPAIFVAAGLGLAWLATLPPLSIKARGAGAILASSILLISGALAVRDYFVRFPSFPEVYYVYDADKLEALAYLNQQAATHEVYFDRLWADHTPVLALRSSKLVKSLDTAETVVLPPVGQNVLYAFPEEKARQADALTTFWPGEAAEIRLGQLGQNLLRVVTLDAAQLADWPPAIQPTNRLEARFDDAPTLLGLRTEPDNPAITLFWRAEAKTLRSLTTFIHLVDADGRRVGQADKLPGNGSYLTPTWSAGERVIERYTPQISDPCAGGEPVRVLVGWYELAADGARRPRMDAPGDTAIAGQLTLPIVAWPLDQVVLPDPLHIAINGQLTLLSARVEGSDLQAGAPLTLDLYWQGGAATAEASVTINLVNDQNSTQVWTGVLAPGAQWPAGEVICRRLRLHLPNDVATGDYRLEIAQPTLNVPFHNLTIHPSTRNFALPARLTTVWATLREEIMLVGYTVAPASTALDVSLIWQAQVAPPTSYTVFVHLLDATGQIVAQSDALPGAGYTTDRWVAGEVVADTHQLTLPENLAPGLYHLAAGMYDPISGQRLVAADKNGQALVDGVVMLGEVQLP